MLASVAILRHRNPNAHYRRAPNAGRDRGFSIGRADKNRAKQMSDQSLDGLPDATSRMGKTSDESFRTNRTMLFDVRRPKGELEFCMRPLARYGVSASVS